MNKVILMGRLTRDPEYRDGQTPFARYTLAVDRYKKDEADFISCVVFNKQAEFARDNFRKGLKIAISGHIQTGRYEKNGQTVYTTDVIVEGQEFCESKKAAEDNAFVPVVPDTIGDLPFK